MEKLKVAGNDRVMEQFVNLGDPCANINLIQMIVMIQIHLILWRALMPL